jgi:uncharacterized protein YecT (DUF1311 family)
MHGAPKLHLGFFSLTLLLSSLAQAQSPSFDCHNANTAREQAICATPQLAALDTQLAAAYKSTLATLSPSAAEEVHSDQRDWLHWLNRVCPRPTLPTGTIAECLTNFYNNRLQQFTTGTQKIDGAVFYPRAHFLFVPGDPDINSPTDNEDPGFGYGQFAWPQIDNPTPPQRAWNQAVYAATLRLCCSGGTGKPTFDAAIDSTGYLFSAYTLIAANSRLIDVNLIISTYDWGAAHPLSGQSSFAWWLDLQRPLKTSDVFAPNTAWQKKLASLTLAKLLKDPGPDALWKQGGELEKAIAGGVIDPKSWDLSSSGLTINFGSYEVGPYSSGWPSATIPWQDLNPQLTLTLNPTTLPATLRSSNP